MKYNDVRLGLIFSFKNLYFFDILFGTFSLFVFE